MNKILFSLLVFSFGLIHAQTPQVFYGGHYVFDINNSWGLGQKEYVARDYILLQNGFHANSLIGEYFRGRIDDKIIVPTDYSSTTPYDETTAATLDFNLPVGSIPGSAAVGPDGSANYTIPIAVPPGINGVQPQLSIIYNSNVPNGLLGLGWNLNGISVITRMSKTVFKDGDLTGINLDGNDLFSLDGQRLVLEANGTTYGGDGVYYRTETESNIRVLSHETQGNGRSMFEVFFPDGSVAEYGFSYNDQNATTIPLRNNNSTALTWYINKYMDRYGNYMLFYYRNKGPQTVVDYILYTGNGATGTDPMNRVDFYYEERTDKNFAYVGGGKIDQTLLLSRIVVRPDLRKETEYIFSYFYDNNLLSSKLNEVKFISKNSEVNSTKIVWKNDNLDIVHLECPDFVKQDIILANSTNDKNKYVSGDFDGDGIAEILIIYGSYEEYYDYNYVEANEHYDFITSSISLKKYNNGDFATQSSIPFSGYICPFFATPYAIDIDGDGVDELAIQTYFPVGSNYESWKYETKYYKIESNAVSYLFSGLIYVTDGIDLHPWNPSNNYVPPVKKASGAFNQFVDFDGDGKPDQFYAFFCETSSGEGAWAIYAKTSENNNALIVNSSDGVKEFNFLDHDGNGKMDIILTYQNGSAIKEYKNIYSSTTSGFQTIYNGGFPTSYHDVYIGDFNGDKKSDILSFVSSANKWHLNYSNGIMHDEAANNSSFLNSLPLLGNGYSVFAIRDINNDGFDDLVIEYKYQQNLSGYLNYVRKFIIYSLKNETCVLISTVTVIHNAEFDQLSYYNIADYTGDGNMDFIAFEVPYDAEFFSYLPDINNKLVSSVNDGNGQKCSFDYTPMTDNSIYDRIVQGANFDTQLLIPIQTPLYIVSEIKQSDYNENLLSDLSYSYSGLLFHRKNRSLAGFLQIETNDKINNIKTVVNSEASENLFKNCRPYQIETYSTDNGTQTLLSRQSIEYYPLSQPYLPTYNPLHASGTGSAFDIRENTFPTKIISFDFINNRKTVEEYDKYFTLNGNNRAEQKITTVFESADANSQPILTTTQTNTLSTSYYCSWFEVQLNETTAQTIQTSDNDSYSRNTTFSYNSNGDLIKTENDPTTETALETNIIEYDLFGHALKITTRAPNDIYGTPIVTNQVEYDPSGRFATKKINTLDQIESSVVSNSWGQPISSTDINGQETRYEYDVFNQLKKTSFPNGTTESYSINWVQNDPDMLFVKTISATANPDAKEYLDAAGRRVRTETVNLNNQTVYSDITYNAKGQTETQSLPYTVPFVPQFSTFEYDNIGRLKKQILPDNSYSESIYSPGLVVSKVYKNGTTQQKTEHYDGAGRLTAVDDNNNTSTQYLYYASGKPREAWVDGMQQHITMQYDLNGNRTLLSDPDAGINTSIYNAYSQLVSQTNANGQVTEWLYDDLGRPLQKNVNAGESTIVWEYDNKPNGFGMLSKVTNTSNNTSDEYFYDGLSRLNVQKQTVEDKEYILRTYYDNNGRVDRITYPGSYTVKYNYQNGLVSELIDYSNGNSIWKALLQDAAGNISQSQYGNTLLYDKSFDDLGRLEALTATVQGTHIAVQDWSYAYDNMGNIESRIDNLTNQNEHFTYDNLNRLRTVWKDDPSAQQSVVTLSMNYDPLGNMTEKSDIGTLKYSANDRPHALKMIYPEAGYEPSDHVLEYYSSGKTKIIKDVVGKTEIRKIEFIYGPDDQRRKTVYTENGNTVTKYFAFGNYEETIENGTGILYISSPDGIVAMRKTVNGTSQMYYVVTDHLGSIDAVVPAVSNVLPAVEYYSFDVWGNRRNPNDWTQSDTRTTFITDRGYTGHEMLDAFGLINANGRIYEPATGRFLSPDDYVQSPDFSQSFNRYAYGYNNPLMFTDPDGENPLILAVLVGGYFGGVAANQGQYNLFKWDWSSEYTYGGILLGGIAGWAGASFGSFVTASSMAGGSTAFAAGVNGGIFGGMLSGGINGGGMPLIYGANAETVFSGITSGALYGGLGGALSGGIGSAFGSFKGVPGSAFKNAMAEMGYSTLKGAASGLAGGSVMAIASDDPSYFWKGAAFGAAFNAGMAGLRIISLGAAIVPEGVQERFAVDDAAFNIDRSNMPVYRRGGVARYFTGGISIGRNLMVDARTLRTDPDWYYESLAHERAHYYQQIMMGQFNFYRRILKEYLIKPGYSNNPYGNSNCLDYWANQYMFVTP